MRHYVEMSVQRHFNRIYEARERELKKAGSSKQPQADPERFVVTILQTGDIRQLYWEGHIADGGSTVLLGDKE
jgi:hypothetical protein